MKIRSQMSEDRIKDVLRMPFVHPCELKPEG